MNAQNSGFSQSNQYGSFQPQQPQQMGHQQFQPNYQHQNKQGGGGNMPTPARNRKPIHTAFFSNVPFTFPMDKFQEFAKQFGEIANIYSLIQNKGIAFVTYYDIRNAQKAVEQANNQLLGNRPVRTNYANKSYFSHQDPRQTCSTIVVKSTVSPSPKMTIHEVISKMKDFGEISAATPLDGQPGCFVVKFFNIKNAHQAMESGPIQIGSETAQLDFKLEDEDNPDIPTQPRQQNQPNRMMQYGMQNQQQQQYGMQQQQQYGQPPQPFYGQPNNNNNGNFYGGGGVPQNLNNNNNNFQPQQQQSVEEALKTLKKFL